MVLQGSAVPLIDADGNPCGSVGVFVDVTERETLMRELQEAQRQIKTLTGLLPICAHCKKIRDEDDRWIQPEVYVRDRSAAEFSHTICPSCAKEHY